jgi:hypothetical protein
MLKKILLAASCAAVFGGASGMDKVKVPLDLKLSHAEMRKAVIAQAVSLIKGKNSNLTESCCFPAELPDYFLKFGHVCLNESGESPDFYTASFLIEILSKPDELYCAVYKKQQWKKLTTDDKADFSKKSGECMSSLKKTFDEKKKLQEEVECE